MTRTMLPAQGSWSWRQSRRPSPQEGAQHAAGRSPRATLQHVWARGPCARLRHRQALRAVLPGCRCGALLAAASAARLHRLKKLWRVTCRRCRCAPAPPGPARPRPLECRQASSGLAAASAPTCMAHACRRACKEGALELPSVCAPRCIVPACRPPLATPRRLCSTHLHPVLGRRVAVAVLVVERVAHEQQVFKLLRCREALHLAPVLDAVVGQEQHTQLRELLHPALRRWWCGGAGVVVAWRGCVCVCLPTRGASRQASHADTNNLRPAQPRHPPASLSGCRTATAPAACRPRPQRFQSFSAGCAPATGCTGCPCQTGC